MRMVDYFDEASEFLDDFWGLGERMVHNFVAGIGWLLALLKRLWR